MAEPWIRVHAALKQKPVIGRAADALDVSWHEAIGFMVCFWGGVAMYARNGDLSEISDRQIETWAEWPGLGYRGRKRKPGQFAAFIRAWHLDADGRVREWDRYAGRLEDRRERDESPDGKSTYVYYAVDGDRCKIGFSGNPWSRIHEMRTASPSIELSAVERGTRALESERHQQFAAIRIAREWFTLTAELETHIESVAQSSQHRSSDRSNDDNYDRSNASLTTSSVVASRASARDARARHETLRNDGTTTTPPPLAREASSELEQWTPPSEAADHIVQLAQRLASDHDRTALDSLIAIVPNPLTWTAEIAASLDGMAGHAHVTPEQAGQAIRDFLGNGAAKEPNLRRFRRYLEQAAGVRAPVLPNANGTTSNGRRPPDVPATRGKAALLLEKIRALTETHQQPGQTVTRFIRRSAVGELGDDVLRAYDAIGGADRVLAASGDKLSYLVRDFADALAALEAEHATA